MLLLVKEVQSRVTTGGELARELNRNIAFFLKDLLALMDRGQVFRLIHTYVTNLQPNNADITLVSFKFQALKILTDYEHYVPLNWPVATRIPSVSILPQVFWYAPAIPPRSRSTCRSAPPARRKNHFPAGLFLRELEPMQLHPDKATRVAAITTFRQLLVRHDIDPRYQKPEAKQRILAVYLPYILMVRSRPSAVALLAPRADSPPPSAHRAVEQHRAAGAREGQGRAAALAGLLPVPADQHRPPPHPRVVAQGDPEAPPLLLRRPCPLSGRLRGAPPSISACCIGLSPRR